MDHLVYLLALLLSVAIFYCTGWAVQWSFLKNSKISGSYQAIFLRVFLGLIVWVLGYSIVKSGGKTFNLALLPVLLFAYFESRKISTGPSGDSPGFWPGLWPTLSVLLAAGVFFAFKLSVQYEGGAFPWVNTLGADYVQHSLISQALQLNGVENKFAPESVMSADFQGLLPYHYFDLWLNALISGSFGFVNYLCLELVTYPFFMLLAFVGIASLWELFRPVNALVIILSILLVGFGSIHIDPYNSIQYLSKANYRLNHFGESALTMPKLLQYLPFALAFAMLLIREHYKLAFLVLTALCLLYFSAMVMFGVIALFVLFNMVWPLWVSRKDALMIGLYSIVPLLVYVGAYYLFSQGFEGTRDSFGLGLTNTEYLRIRINIFGLSSIQTSVMYAPLVLGLALVILASQFKKILDKKVLLLALLAVSVFVVGLLSWVLALENADGMQLVGNNMPVVNMLLLALFVLLLDRALQYTQRKWAIIAGAVLFLGISVYVTLDDVLDTIERKHYVAAENSMEYKQAVSQLFADEQLLIGGYLKGEEEYMDKQYSHAHKVSQSFRLGFFMAFLPQYYATVHMSVLDIPYTNQNNNPMEYRREVKAIHGTLFYRFVEEQQEQGSFVSNGQAQADFIKKYGIKYLIASRSAVIAPEVNNLIGNEIVDSKTGERFIVLQYSGR